MELRNPGVADPTSGYPWSLPAVQALAAPLVLHPHVTYLVGENGSGKSTLLEAIAVAAGMNAEGGGSNFQFATRPSHSELWDAVKLSRGLDRPLIDFFLRAESLYTTATYLEELEGGQPPSYGERDLHAQSHGELFLAIFLNRFAENGLYLLDEPEAALSPQNCLTFLRRLHELVETGCQFVIATHSPILLAYPNALIYEFTDSGPRETAYDDTDLVRLTRGFLAAPGRFLGPLLD